VTHSAGLASRFPIRFEFVDRQLRQATSRQLILRGLTHWRTNAVVLGVATAVAVLAGALLVGDSVRGSLRDLVLQRLGRADRAVLASGFFREALSDDLRQDQGFSAAFDFITPLIAMQGLVSEQATGRRASRVQVYGVDERFWRFHEVFASGPVGRQALISPALARDIGAALGSSVLVRIEKPSAVPLESLHGRKDNTGRIVRLSVRAILDASQMGEFSLQARQGEVRAVFVPLKRLQQDLEVTGRVNALLVSDRPGGSGASAALDAAIRRRFALEDVGLSVRVVSDVLAVESAAVCSTRAREGGGRGGRGRFDDGRGQCSVSRQYDSEWRPAVPYSLVTAADLKMIAADHGSAEPRFVLNDWTARDLGAKVGDPVTLEYYAWEDPGASSPAARTSNCPRSCRSRPGRRPRPRAGLPGHHQRESARRLGSAVSARPRARSPR
jgi:hypothetical protein